MPLCDLILEVIPDGSDLSKQITIQPPGVLAEIIKYLSIEEAYQLLLISIVFVATVKPLLDGKDQANLTWELMFTEQFGEQEAKAKGKLMVSSDADTQQKGKYSGWKAAYIEKYIDEDNKKVMRKALSERVFNPFVIYYFLESKFNEDLKKLFTKSFGFRRATIANDALLLLIAAKLGLCDDIKWLLKFGIDINLITGEFNEEKKRR